MSDLKEFLAFKNSSEQVPRELSEQTLARMESALLPRWEHILVKVSVVQTLVGFLSLAVCHQFGLNPFGTTRSLADLVMAHWGHGACMVFCGLFFSLLGWTSVQGLLNLEERRWLHRHGLGTVSVWALATLLVFLWVGAEGLTLQWGGLWVLGALVAGSAVLRGFGLWDQRKLSSQFGS